MTDMPDDGTTWEQRMAERAFARALIAKAREGEPQPPEPDPEVLAGFLAKIEMTADDARDWLCNANNIACACVGPRVIGYPCSCALNTMKARDVLGIDPSATEGNR